MVSIDSLCHQLQSPNAILGLDAYGVIYNDDGVIDTIYSVFDYCHRHGIDIYMMTNNANQSISDIAIKMDRFGLPIPRSHIISSACACYELPDIHAMLANHSVYVYGRQSSHAYIESAGGRIVAHPDNADVVVLSASLNTNNHRTYRMVHEALQARPQCPVLCLNPDFFVMNRHGLKRVMGFYAHQMARQLGRQDWIWAGKPYPMFSEVVRRILSRHGHDPSHLVFCDDNPNNVRQMVNDLDCTGVIISQTGIANHTPMTGSFPSTIVDLPICQIL